MTMNPPAPAPSRREVVGATIKREVSRRADLVVFIIGILVGFGLSRV